MEVEESLKVVLQDGNKDCGISALLSIIRYFGGNISKEYLRSLTGTNKNGVSIYQLMEAATTLGFSCEGVKGEVSFLDLSKLPCIAHIVYQKKYQHFVVIYKIDFDKNEVVLMDPAKGKVVLSVSAFQMLSSGYFLYLVPNKSLPCYYEKKTLFKLLSQFLKQYKIIFLIIIIASFLLIFIEILLTFHFQYLYDFAVSYKIIDNIFVISYFLLAFCLFLICFKTLKNYLILRLNLFFDHNMSLYFYKQILLLPYLFFKNRPLGEILERLRDVSEVKNFVLGLFTSIVSNLLFFILFFILLYRIHYIFLLLLLGYFVVLVLLSFFFFRKKERRLKKLFTKKDFVQSFLVETFQNVDTIKGLHLEYDFLEQIEKYYQIYLEKNYEFQKIVFLENFLKQSFYYVLNLLFFGFGSCLLIDSNISIASFIICQQIFNYLMQYGEDIMSFFFNSYKIPLSISRIEELFSIFRENFEGGSYYQLLKLDGDIVFRHLSFSYGLKTIFSDFSFTIFSHSKVLITGKSGCGKSSLVKIIMRYLEVNYGVVRIGGIDINHIHLDVIRNNISYVTGNELLFSNTLLYNITLGREIEEERVKKVISLVKLDEVVERLPLKLMTMVEENGFNFSGGERGKILLARALLKVSDIYIFDEAFHQIDIEQEHIILGNIFNYLREKTIIVISHRLNNLDYYDKRYRLEDGEMHEF